MPYPYLTLVITKGRIGSEVHLPYSQSQSETTKYTCYIEEHTFKVPANPTSPTKRAEKEEKSLGNNQEWSEFKVVDSTGAGDAFDAGFLGRWITQYKRKLDGDSLKGCLFMGSSCGTLNCTRHGACVKPIELGEVEMFCEMLEKEVGYGGKKNLDETKL